MIQTDTTGFFDNPRIDVDQSAADDSAASNVTLSAYPPCIAARQAYQQEMERLNRAFARFGLSAQEALSAIQEASEIIDSYSSPGEPNPDGFIKCGTAYLPARLVEHRRQERRRAVFAPEQVVLPKPKWGELKRRASRRKAKSR